MQSVGELNPSQIKSARINILGQISSFGKRGESREAIVEHHQYGGIRMLKYYRAPLKTP